MSQIINITEDGGLTKEILREGTGSATPKKGAEVSVHYVGTLLDGTKFDSSRDRNEYFKFNLGQGAVIKGWDQGVITMKKGELARLTCKPDYAYGANGSPPKIPPNATLQFEVELISWTSLKDVSKAKDGSLLMAELEKGEGYSRPGNEDRCIIKYAIKRLSGSGEDGFEANPENVLLAEEREFVVGEEQVPRFLEVAAKELRKGGVAEYVVSADSHPDYEPGQALHLHLTLVDLISAPTPYQLEPAELFVQAGIRKAQGNELYKVKNWKRALEKYKRGVEFLDSQSKMSDDEKKRAKTEKALLLGNQAAVYVQQSNWGEVLSTCNKVLEIEKANFKALLRKARAQLERDEWLECKSTLNKALEVQPDDKDALRVKADLARRQRAHAEKEKAVFGGLFNKLGDLGYPDKPVKQPKVEVQDKMAVDSDSDSD